MLDHMDLQACGLLPKEYLALIEQEVIVETEKVLNDLICASRHG